VCATSLRAVRVGHGADASEHPWGRACSSSGRPGDVSTEIGVARERMGRAGRISRRVGIRPERCVEMCTKHPDSPRRNPGRSGPDSWRWQRERRSESASGTARANEATPRRTRRAKRSTRTSRHRRRIEPSSVRPGTVRETIGIAAAGRAATLDVPASQRQRCRRWTESSLIATLPP
jgi:hypothetical protein